MVKEQAAVNEEAFFIPLLSAGLFEVASHDVGNLNMNAVSQLKAWEMT